MFSCQSPFIQIFPAKHANNAKLILSVNIFRNFSSALYAENKLRKSFICAAH